MLAILLITVSGFFQAAAIYLNFNWFVIDVMDVQPIGFFTAWGLGITVSALRGFSGFTPDNPFEALGISITNSALLIVVGFIIHLF